MCPICKTKKSKVLETRGEYRRRQCVKCGARWSTVEQIIPNSTAQSSSRGAWAEVTKGLST